MIEHKCKSIKMDSVLLSENRQKYAPVEIKAELYDEEVKDVSSIETKGNFVLSPQYTAFTEVSMTSSIKKNKLQPQLIVCIERLPAVSKAQQGGLKDCLLDGEDIATSFTKVNVTSNVKKNKRQSQLFVCIQRLPVVIKAEQDISFKHLRDYLSGVEDTDEYLKDFNGKQIHDDYLDVKSIKHEEIHIKSEDEDDRQFNIDNNNEIQIKEEFSDFISIEQEEDEEDHQFKIASSTVNNDKKINPTSKAARTNDFYQMNSNKEEPPMFKCSKCSYQTRHKGFMSRHVLSHVPKVFQCPHCTHRTKSKQLLKRHGLVHIPKEEAELHKCPKCPFKSRWKRGLIRHLLIHKKPDEITWYHCPHCSFKARHKHNLKDNHMTIHRKEQPMYKCASCSYESPRKYVLLKHLRHVHRPKNMPLISCPEINCLFKTRDQLYLKEHIKRGHHKDKFFFKCSKCPYETKYAQSFKAHELGHDHPDKCFSCSLCPFRTTRMYDLTQHDLVHKTGSEIKWFRCLECSFKSKYKRCLRQHKLIHISEAQKVTDWFHCYVCTYMSRYKYDLSKHIRAKHRDTEGRISGGL